MPKGIRGAGRVPTKLNLQKYNFHFDLNDMAPCWEVGKSPIGDEARGAVTDVPAIRTTSCSAADFKENWDRSQLSRLFTVLPPKVSKQSFINLM